MSLFKPALLSSLKNYNRQHLAKDLISGSIVGVVAFPLAIVFAIASGVNPEDGIITAAVAGFVVSVLGGSKVQIAGPTGAFIGIIYGIIQQYGVGGLTVATLMAGAFLILMGALRLGTIIKFIPYPIVVGFTSGIAVTIFSTQVKDLLGLQLPSVPADFIEKWICYARHIGSIDLWTTATGLLSIAIIQLTPKFSKTLPGTLAAILVTTIGALLLRQYAGVGSIETIGDRFTISGQLPGLRLPDISWEAVKSLVGPALTIAVLGAIESLLSATVADGMTGNHHDSNTELIGQGIANLATPLFGGIPATGAIARTMININNGGRSPIAGVTHAVVLLLIFLVLMPYASYIPMACLAGVLVVVSYNMSGWRSFRRILHNPKSDVTVLLITFFLTIIVDLTVAIEVGLIAAFILFMRRMAENTDVRRISRTIDVNDDVDSPLNQEEHLVIPPGVDVFEINGPFFFGTGLRFEDIMSRIDKKPRVRIIRMRKVPFVDSTGIHNLTSLCESSQKDGIRIVLSGVRPSVHAVLEKSGFNELVGQENICANIQIALSRAAALAAQPRKR
jgi:SulP family sulfate permease